MDTLLDISGAVRSFAAPEGGKVRALDGVDLSVGSKEFVTLLGPSGCGKTTLLRAISGFEVLDGGAIRLDGEDIASIPAHKRPVNTVFQSYALFSHMTVARNVGYALEVAKAPKAKRATRVAEALEMVGLADMGGRRPSQLSGGQRQRVALARAIISRPKLLLLDEPLSALDRRLRQQMQIELKSLQSDLGIAFVFVTHDQEEALTMSDRIVVMRDGRIEQAGAPREIFRRPRNRFVAEFIGETNLLDLTVDTVKDGVATGVTVDGLRLRFPSGSLAPGHKATATLRPTDLSFGQGAATISGRVAREVYLGADLHYVVATQGGTEIQATARDEAGGAAVGDEVTLSYDPARVHMLEQG